MIGVNGVLSRIAELQARLGVQPPTPPTATVTPDARGNAATSGADSFAAQLAGLTGIPATGNDGATDVLGPSAIRPASLIRATALPGVPYGDLFVKAGTKYGISPKLLAAVAKVESGYDSRAVSPVGARGLMQLMPTTARGLGVNDSFDPEQAIDGGARLLAANLREFRSVPLALAAYNAGGGAVRRYGGIPPFAETQAYVPKVQQALAALGG